MIGQGNFYALWFPSRGTSVIVNDIEGGRDGTEADDGCSEEI